MKSGIFLFVFLLFFQFSVQSQNDSLLKIVEKLSSKTEKIKVFNTIAQSYWYKSPARVIEYGTKALLLAEDIKNDTLIVSSKLNIGIGYSSLGENYKAMRLFIQCLEISKKTNYLSGESGAWSNLAILYDNMGDYEKARKSNQEALAIFKKINHKKGIIGALNNIGINYTKTKHYDKAYEYYNRALSIEKEVGDKQMIAITFVNIGDVFDYKGDKKKALSYYEKSLQISRELNNASIEIVSMINIGRMKQANRELKEALEYFNKSLDLAVKFEFRDFKRDIYKYISSVYQEQNNISEAFSYYKKYSELKDSISSSELNKRIAELHIKYETDAKQKENELLNNENKYQRNLLYFFYVLGLLLLIVGLVLYRSYLQKKKTNEILFSKNKIITEQKNQLSESLDNLQKSEELYRSLVNTSPDGIVITGLDATINYVSPALIQLMGVEDQNELLGSSFFDPFDKNDFYKVENYFKDLKQNNSADHIELICNSRNNRVCNIEINGGVLKNMEGKTINLIFMLRDVTKRKQIEAENTRQKDLIIEQQQEIAKLELLKKEQENANLKKELEHKVKELTSKAMNIIQNNERNLSIIQSLRLIEMKVEKKEKLTSSEIRSIMSELKIVSREDSWNEFEAHFVKVNRDFYDNLAKKFPDLSPNERKLCAFLSLNLSTKEISDITNKSTHSIDVARTRLRQKLGLSNTGDNLAGFLNQL